MTRPAYPTTRLDTAVEELHGERIPDPYRWLEDGTSEETRSWTAAQNQVTQLYLDGVAARPLIQQRLATLLQIGSLSAPTPARGRYFYQRREGTQNQPVLYVREGGQGSDRVLLDPNALDAAGTTALDWYFPSDDGRLLAYGLSENGSEESVLRVMDVGTGALLPDRIAPCRAADLAWLPDNSGFYYTRYPAPGRGARRRRRSTTGRSTSTGSGDDPAADRADLQAGSRRSTGPVSISRRTGAGCVVSVARTFDQTDLYLQDRVAGGPLLPVVKDLPHSFEGHVVGGRLYIRTNLGRAATTGSLVTDPAAPAREHWREIVPTRADAVLDGCLVTRETLVALLSRSGRVPGSASPGSTASTRARCTLPTIGSLFGWGAEPDGDELFYGFSSYTRPAQHLSRSTCSSGDARRSGSGWRPISRPNASRCARCAIPRRTARRSRMFLVHARALTRNGENPDLSHRLWRVQHQHDALVLPLGAGLAGAGRCRRDSQPSWWW